jgi:hypothetical protein
MLSKIATTPPWRAAPSKDLEKPSRANAASNAHSYNDVLSAVACAVDQRQPNHSSPDIPCK